jgi:hypothetical protein
MIPKLIYRILVKFRRAQTHRAALCVHDCRIGGISMGAVRFLDFTKKRGKRTSESNSCNNQSKL